MTKLSQSFIYKKLIYLFAILIGVAGCLYADIFYLSPNLFIDYANLNLYLFFFQFIFPLVFLLISLVVMYSLMKFKNWVRKFIVAMSIVGLILPILYFSISPLFSGFLTMLSVSTFYFFGINKVVKDFFN